MQLHRLSIRNYRSIPPEGVDLFPHECLSALVGKNNAGKSNILTALELVAGSKNPRYLAIDEEDFFDPVHPITIELELANIDWGTGRRAGLSDRQCAILTKGKGSLGHLTFRFLAAGPAQSSDSDDDEGEAEAARTVVLLLANHHEVHKFEEVRKRLIGLVTVPALRSQSDLLSPSTWTAYGQLLRSVVEEHPAAETLHRLIQETTGVIQQILQSETEALAAHAKLTAYVERVLFEFTKGGNPSELLRNLSIAVEYAGRSDPIDRVGTGTQSAVILGILELCLKHKARSGLRLFVVEEPELFLHPQAQRRVASLLRELSNEPQTQVIVTTHSGPVLAGRSIPMVVRVGRRLPDGGTFCVATKSREAPPEGLRAQEAEMFFADHVVLVEGESEAELLPRIAEVIKDERGISLSPDLHNCSVIDVGGKERFGHFTALLDELQIPWRVVADRDALTGATLIRYKGLAGFEGTEDPDTQIAGLRGVGVAVLKDGEIEDYYPGAALAAIAGCREEEVATAVASRSKSYDELTTIAILTAVVERHRKEMAEAPELRLPKVVKRAYDQTIEELRRAGEVPTIERKTGDILTLWLKLSKPQIARRVADHLTAHPDQTPPRLAALVRWLFATRET